MLSDTTTSLTPPIVLHLGAALARLSDGEFQQFCELNRDWRIERSTIGDLIIMPPTGGSTGWRNFSLATQLGVWCERDKTGIGFDSSTGFSLPNGARRSPDVAWVVRGRWESLSVEQREEFPPLAPDFVVELRSKFDSLDELRAKMREYRENGVRLAWLIDPYTQCVEVYRPGEDPLTLAAPSTISADPELPGFTLDLTRIW